MPVLVATGLVALVAAIGAASLEADAGTDQLVDNDSDAYLATEDFKQEFGDDAVVVLVKGSLEQLVLTSDLATLLSLEGCLSGNAPGGVVFTDKPAPQPCAELAETKPARVVYGPATFLNQFAIQAGELLEEQTAATQRQARAAGIAALEQARRAGLSEAVQRAAAEAAASEVLTAFEQQVVGLALDYGLTGLPSLDDPVYVQNVVFDSRNEGEPKARFAYLFPSAESALISVRLRPELTEAERRDAIDLIRDATEDPAFQIRDTEYVVSGVPVVVEGLADKLSSEIFVLLGAALIVMMLTLALVFGPPFRLLPLVIALATAGIVFGLLAAVGGSLTMASLAVLPVLIGLAVDYAIQFQARFTEALEAGSSPARAALDAAANGGPVIATAALATGAGFLVLLLSPIPMIRGFGLLLVAGIAIAFTLALTAGLAALSLANRRSSAPGAEGRPPDAEGRPPGADAPVDAQQALTRRERTRRGRSRRSSSGASRRNYSAQRHSLMESEAVGRILKARGDVVARLRHIGRRAVAVSVAAPGRVLAVGLAIAVVGWAVGTRTEIVSDIRELVPRDLPELQNVDELQDATGVSGEVDVTVTTEDITDPEVIAWMRDYKERVLERAGFGSESRCLDAETLLCPSIALTDLFGEETAPTRERVERVLALLPAYFSQAVVDLEPEDGGSASTAVIAFGIKVMPFDEQKELIDAIRAEIDPPGTENDAPPGVTAEVVGLPVLVADASAALDSNRYLLTLAGLFAVALALLAAYRSPRRALVPLIPIALATGWSALGLAIAGVPLNPMSATLGALVIAIATEFSVLLAARYEEERARTATIGEALRRAYSRTGMAVLASGITAIAGFAALIATDIRMLRDFGIVTVIDLGVALGGVLVILPAALIWAERGFAPFGRRKPPENAPAPGFAVGSADAVREGGASTL